MPGPFEGRRVLELGRFIAVPMCGQMLGEGGACGPR
jgi:crotonobetainyl-CoA:carnitine CoA-transferase CaiB-like acyl-CoA transferase